MSEALYEVGGLRFWTEREILVREQSIQTLRDALTLAMQRLNSAWTFHRVEGPVLTPRRYISPAYDDSDIFAIVDEENPLALRAETTMSSYLCAVALLQGATARAPLCVWQAGKSYRRERNDGARASELRFNEFWQCEFQCLYAANSKADYRAAAEQAVQEAIRCITRSAEVRLVESDRLPSYSLRTRDVEVPFGDKWKEMASISTRTDFPADRLKNVPPDGYHVLEVAVGLDRLVCVERVN